MDAKKIRAVEKSEEEHNRDRLTIPQGARRDYEALNAWLDQIITNLEEKSPDSETHLIHARALKVLFLQVGSEWEIAQLDASQAVWVVHLLELVLWTLQLSICATIAESQEQSRSHSGIFTEISNHLFINFILLKDNLICLLLARFDSFDERYANMLVYSVIKNFVSFYKTYCSWFDDRIYIVKEDMPELLIGWEKIRWFLRRLRNKVEHEYNKSSERKIDLRDFDPLLEVDYEDNCEYHKKLGNKVHKYPLAILVMIRFLLKNQDSTFSEMNEKWFSCNRKVYDQFGNVKQMTKLEKAFGIQ